MEFFAPLVAKILFEPEWKVAISAPPSPSPEMIADFSVTVKNFSLADTGASTVMSRRDSEIGRTLEKDDLAMANSLSPPLTARQNSNYERTKD
mgnify:CR=1 FL=1